MNTAGRTTRWAQQLRPVKKENLIFSAWARGFLQATDYDRWEQDEKAITKYNKLYSDMDNFIKTGISETNHVEKRMSDEQKEVIRKVMHCIFCRTNCIKNENKTNLWPSLSEIMKLKTVIKSIATWRGVFPVLILDDFHCVSEISLNHDSGLSGISSDEDEERSGNLLPRLPKHRGYTRLSIVIEKIGLKNTNLVEPYITVSLRDSVSVTLTPFQHTGTPANIDDYHLEFHTKVEIQKYVEKIPKESNIFFELKHRLDGKFVPKCYAVLSKDELQTGKGFLELYKGQTDYHLKSVKKLSQNKPLYLHINMTLID